MNLPQLRKKMNAALKLYSCTDWTIDLQLMDPNAGEELASDDGTVIWSAQGLCSATNRYRQALIQINPDLDDKRVDYVVQHEAAHVLLNEMRETFQRIIDVLPYELREPMTELFTDAEEHTCDRLARSPMHKVSQ